MSSQLNTTVKGMIERVRENGGKHHSLVFANVLAGRGATDLLSCLEALGPELIERKLVSSTALGELLNGLVYIVELTDQLEGELKNE